jgi:membrane-bound serine protease (ClpP class)
MNALQFQKKLLSMQENMMNFALMLTANRDDAQDLMQDTTLKVLDNQEKFVDNINFKGWVLTVMRNIFINNYHKIVRTQTVVDQGVDLYNLDEVITQYLGYKDYKMKSYIPSWQDDLKGFLMNPIFQSILIIIIIGGIYFEMQTPGLGFPSAASLLAAILYFAPLYIDGLAANWEIQVFIIGILLLAVEIFIIPGFGVAGISGIILIIGGLVMGLLNNDHFDFEGVSGKEIGKATLTVLVGLVTGFSLMIWLSNKIGHRGMFRKVALNTDLENAISSPDLSSLVGKEGTAATVLRPSGKVSVDGVFYDGISESGFIEKGGKVKVVRFENAQVYVENL